ncbi:hypothetical protein TMatcc_003110 [Talaromyces marneffei ATCC 18224]
MVRNVLDESVIGCKTESHVENIVSIELARLVFRNPSSSKTLHITLAPSTSLLQIEPNDCETDVAKDLTLFLELSDRACCQNCCSNTLTRPLNPSSPVFTEKDAL